MRGRRQEAIPALCELLGTENVATIRAQCAWALQDICERVDAPSAQQAVAPLAKALLDNDAEVRTLAANALGAIGRAAKDALPELKKALKDRDGEVRQAAEKALERIGE